MTTTYKNTRPRPNFGTGGRIDIRRIKFSRGWLATGAVGGVLGLGALWRWGWPVAALGGAVSAAMLGHMRFRAPRRPRLDQVALAFRQLPPALDGLRIAQLSDLHLGFPYTEANARWAVAQVMALQPDLIVITGDIVHYARAIPAIPTALAGLHAPLGMYAVAGNHDHWEGVADVAAQLRAANVTLLHNEHRVLTHKGIPFVLAGVDDVWEGECDPAAALAGAPSGMFRIMLSHAPDTADEIAPLGVDLQLSGHTHGGQLRLPGIGAFSAPRHGVRYMIGGYNVNAMQLYVTRGLGGAPLRLRCPPEATVLTLRRG